MSAAATSDQGTSVFISAPDGLRLHVRDYGPRLATRRPVICLPGLTRTVADFEALTGCRVHLLFRIDTLIDRLLNEGAEFEEISGRFAQTLEERHAAGWKGLKTIVAYRTGLAIDPLVGEREAARSVLEGGPLKRRAKPLRDYLLRKALAFAAEARLPALTR